MAHNSRSTGAHAMNDLPSEILSAICSHLSRKSCYQVIQVSHRFKAIVEPSLYANIKLHVGGYPDDNRTQSFDSLVGNIKDRPKLGFYVSALTLRICVCTFDRYDELLQRLPNIRYLELAPPRNDLMLRGMRRLERLRLRYDMFWDYCIRQSIPTDQRISKVEIMARHFRMPTLRQLEVNMPDLDVDGRSNPFIARAQKTTDPEQPNQRVIITDKQLADCQPGDDDRDSSITTLRLTNCGDMHLGVLPDMLQLMKGLERFTFTIDCAWESEHMRTPGISPRAIGRSLEPHMDTLVELIIAGDNAAWFLDTSLFGTLGPYRHLKRLAIPEPFLVPDYVSTLHQCLPAQLEDLQLQYPMGFEQGLDNQRKIRHARMKNLASDRYHPLPKLKRIVWWYQQAECWSEAGGHTTRYGGNEALTELAGLFEVVGVNFEWLSIPYFHETPFGAREFGSSWWLER